MGRDYLKEFHYGYCTVTKLRVPVLINVQNIKHSVVATANAIAHDVILRKKVLQIETGDRFQVERVLGSDASGARGVEALLRPRGVHPHISGGDAKRRGVAVEHDGAQAVQGQARDAPEPALHHVGDQLARLAVQALVAHRVRGVVAACGDSSNGIVTCRDN